MLPGIQTFCTHARTHAHTLVEAFSTGPSGYPGNSGSFWCSEQNHKHGTEAWSSRFVLEVSGYFAFYFWTFFFFLLKPTAPDDSALDAAVLIYQLISHLADSHFLKLHSSIPLQWNKWEPHTLSNCAHNWSTCQGDFLFKCKGWSVLFSKEHNRQHFVDCQACKIHITTQNNHYNKMIWWQNA